MSPSLSTFLITICRYHARWNVVHTYLYGLTYCISFNLFSIVHWIFLFDIPSSSFHLFDTRYQCGNLHVCWRRLEPDLRPRLFVLTKNEDSIGDYEGFRPLERECKDRLGWFYR